MQNIYIILLSGLSIALVSFVGIILIKFHRKIAFSINKNIHILSTVSAGIFLMTSFFLIRETLSVLRISVAFITFISGILIYIILHKLVCSHEHSDISTKKHKSALKVLIGDAFHNIADGLILVASFGAGTAIGITNTISIILHEIPQEISKFFILKEAGNSSWKASLKSFFAALSIFIGITLGLFLTQQKTIQAYFFGITSTFFLGVVFHDLFPIYEMRHNKKNLIKRTPFLILGMIIMFFIGMLIHKHH